MPAISTRTLASQAPDSDGYGNPPSLKRDIQALAQLEDSLTALVGRGVVSGGVVTSPAAFTARVPAGTVFFADGVLLTLAADQDRSGLDPSATVHLWGKITVTRASPANPNDPDTYALTLTHNTTGSSPGTGYFRIAVLTTGGAGVTAIDNQPAGKFIAGLPPAKGTATAVAGAATLHMPAGKVTTESLTTASGAVYTLVLTNSLISPSSLVFVSVATGTNTAPGLLLRRVQPGSGSVEIHVENEPGGGALNGTIVLSFFCIP